MRCRIKPSSFICMPPLLPLLVHSAGLRVHGSIVEIFAPLPTSLLVGAVSCSSCSCASGSVLSLRVPNAFFAEQFPELVRRYAHMTKRLVEALQAVGVTTNGAAAARILSELAMPTTAKTIIRRVLELALPKGALFAASASTNGPGRKVRTQAQSWSTWSSGELLVCSRNGRWRLVPPGFGTIPRWI